MGYKRSTKSAEQLQPDARYNSKLVSKFVNCLMWDGKKSIASRVFYDAMDIVEKRVKDVPPLEVFETAVGNVKPSVEVRSKRVGGSNYQVPMQVNFKRQQSLAIRWIIQAARGRSGRPMAQSLAQEFVDAHRGEGTAMTARTPIATRLSPSRLAPRFAAVGSLRLLAPGVCPRCYALPLSPPPIALLPSRWRLPPPVR